MEGEYLSLDTAKKIAEKDKEIERLNNIINRTTKYVQSLSSKGRGCDIYEDIKQEILKELKGSESNEWRRTNRNIKSIWKE